MYRVDVATGKRDKILTQVAVRRHASARAAAYALYQQDGQWWSLDIATGARTNLTGKIKSTFVNMEDDHPVPERRAYGVAGFTTGEKSAIVYDRFDLWQVNVDGSNPVRLTRGKEDSTVYRCAVRVVAAAAAVAVVVAAAVRDVGALLARRRRSHDRHEQAAACSRRPANTTRRAAMRR